MQLFKGLSVVTLAQTIAALFATRQPADLGASAAGIAKLRAADVTTA